jgi:branched-chain amino acid transport system permease protein
MVVGLRVTMTTGQVSFAHAAFVAIGAYSSALLTMKLGISFWFTLPLAGVIAMIIAVLIGFPILKLKGVHFFLVTFAFGSVVMLIVTNWWIDVFGGTKGLLNIPCPNPIAISGLPKIEFDSIGPFYYLGLVVTLIVVIFALKLDRSRFGRVLRAIRQQDSLAESLGVNIFRYKMLGWVIACFFAGLAGSLFAHMHKVITPGDFQITLSIYCVIYAIVGGEYKVSGPIIGTVFLSVVGEYLRGYGSIEPLAYGVALVLVMIFMPDGILGLVQHISLWSRQTNLNLSRIGRLRK